MQILNESLPLRVNSLNNKEAQEVRQQLLTDLKETEHLAALFCFANPSHKGGILGASLGVKFCAVLQWACPCCSQRFGCNLSKYAQVSLILSGTSVDIQHIGQCGCRLFMSASIAEVGKIWPTN